MSYCAICGDESGVKYYPGKYNALCPSCAVDTPDKIHRDNFNVAYWGKGWEDVPQSTRREFYDDYLASTCTLDEYIKQTTEEV